METGFKNVLKDDSDFKTPKSVFRNNWKMPEYDKRTSCFVGVGQEYGVGHRQPVGTETQTMKSAVPFGRPKTLDLYAKE